MSRPIFFIKRGDRLIARLKHLFYAWRFARQVDGTVIMAWGDELPEYWHQFDGTMYSASLIFDLQEFYARGGAESLVFMGERIGAAPRRWDGPSLHGPEYAAMRYNRFPRDLFKKPGLVFYESHALRFQLEDERKTGEQIYRELNTLFNELPPTPYLKRLIEQLRTRLGNSSYVGIHVRRGDVYDRLRTELPGLIDGTMDPARFAFLIGHYVVRTAPQELFEPAVRKALSEGKKIAYFSDSPESIEAFKKRFGGSHFLDMSKFRTKQPIQKAYLDFVMLKDAERIVSTRSNYASFGAQLSGAEHVIVSAADTTQLSPDDVVELYYETAVREFLPSMRVSPAIAMRLREEIRKVHLRVNSAQIDIPREAANA